MDFLIAGRVAMDDTDETNDLDKFTFMAPMVSRSSNDTRRTMTNIDELLRCSETFTINVLMGSPEDTYGIGIALTEDDPKFFMLAKLATMMGTYNNLGAHGFGEISNIMSQLTLPAGMTKKKIMYATSPTTPSWHPSSLSSSPCLWPWTT